MKLSRLSRSFGLVALLAVAPACGDGDADADRPGARRGRGAPVAEMTKENVSKVAYPVDADASGEPVEPGDWRAGRLEPSDPRLDDRTHYDVWLLSGAAGERFTITMESPDFDAFLMVAGPLGPNPTILAEDDDGAGGTDARIDLLIPESGRYAVIANSVFPAEVGRYRIRLDAAATTVPRPADQRTANDR